MVASRTTAVARLARTRLLAGEKSCSIDFAVEDGPCPHEPDVLGELVWQRRRHPKRLAQLFLGGEIGVRARLLDVVLDLSDERSGSHTAGRHAVRSASPQAEHVRLRRICAPSMKCGVMITCTCDAAGSDLRCSVSADFIGRGQERGRQHDVGNLPVDGVESAASVDATISTCRVDVRRSTSLQAAGPG